MTDRPPFFHPDREALWAAETALQTLDSFKLSSDYDRILDGPAGQIRSNLESAVAFVSRLDHGIAWIGPVGVGKTTALSLLTNLMAPNSHPCLGAPSTPVQQAINSFQQLCATGPLSPKAVLARAEAGGWRVTGRDAPATFDPTTQRLSPVGEPSLLLNVTTEASHGEQRDTCGVAIAVPTSGLATVAQDWLGFAPTFAMSSSATYSALRTGDDWRSGATLSPAEFAKAKGRFYSIVVGDRGSEEADVPYPAFVMLLHVQPVQQAYSGH